ncbi:MAG: T9SS type A sorting domain-containing protein, partial [Flavobacteriales bacterium]|nr:T9SS type A sorting domain-containing protein [Flavobacteriales bacterium]
DRYHFKFTDGPNVFTRTKSSYGVFLYDVPGLQLNKTYSVTVQVRVDGQWSAPGPACDIIMAGQPDATEVQNTYCNGTYTIDAPNYILAEYIYAATQYEWRFVPLGAGPTQTDMTNGLALYFHTTDLELQEGEMYDVAVRAYAGGLWGDFASTCPITMTGAPAIEGDSEVVTKLLASEESQLQIFPNPNNGSQVRIDLELGQEVMDVVHYRVMDITGQLVHSGLSSLKGSILTEVIDFENALPPGIYLLQAEVDGLLYTSRFAVE